MIIRQFEVGDYMVFSYIIGDEETGEALVIDPADDAQRLINFAQQHEMDILYILNTHSHIDHTMGNAEMVRRTGAKIIIHEAESYPLCHPSLELLSLFQAEPSPPADILVKDGDTIWVGELGLKIIHTPGHSPGSISLYLEDMVFTGDTLFVGAVGRTDLPGGSWETLEASIRHRLFTLPDDTVVLPGHNYGSAPTSTIRQEKLTNPCLRL
ncbi:MAG: MBL fold metallo-hydrolase [Deltaproteobacteria bacterium]|nr:MAG: MBL fold metallo-hydrolase [Deltaproteobacteria bacterium]